jgi:hypothetical protein
LELCKTVIADHVQRTAQREADAAAERSARQAAEETRELQRQAALAAAAAHAEAEAESGKESAAIREADAAARAAKRAAEEQIFRQLDGLIRKASGALRDGDTKRASGIRRAIDEKAVGAPPLPPQLIRHLEELDGKLAELKQWKDYAVAPKRIELIDEMESLVGSSDEPPALAARIKDLQEQWRTISKGLVSEAPEEWERFHQAAQAAYLPCKAHFEAQAKIRQDNLAQRRAVLERLTAFEASQQGDSFDWRVLTTVLREAPQEWRRHFPVEREPNRALQIEFSGATERLQARLDEWYQRNVVAKQELIGRARAAIASEDTRGAIEAVKRLQLSWKETGPAPREKDRALWSEFRELCDAAFQKREQAHTDYTAALEASKVQAVELCEEVERVAALSGAPLIEGVAKAADWRAAFDALGEMPRADARGLQERFERALELCRSQTSRQRLRDSDRSVTDLAQAAALIRAYEWALMNDTCADDLDAHKQAVAGFMADVSVWPKGGAAALKDALAGADALQRTGAADREKALRTLCVRCEIGSQSPTPAEDEALRRAYQVQRLMQGMGQGSSADGADWNTLLLLWIGIGAIEPALHRQLQARFMRYRPGAEGTL